MNITRLIGGTPLFELKNYCRLRNLKAKIFAKLEMFNPAGSIKDRVAAALIKAAEAEGKLKEGGTIIEPTSGNTGIALAAIGGAKGYKVILTMPETASSERVKLIKAYGAKVILTNGKLGMQGAVDMANALLNEDKRAISAGQFTNSANPSAHFRTTGPEIYAQTHGKIAAFVAGVGTGGTLTGAGAFLKSQNPQIRVYAVEPASSPVLTGGASGAHKIQGIGAGFIPKVLNPAVYDGVLTVSDESAFGAQREIALTEGLFVGVSSGAALCAATALASRSEFQNKNIVTIFPDGGERYLSVL